MRKDLGIRTYTYYIKTNHLCAQEETATSDDQEEVACTENSPNYNKDVEVVPLNVTLEQINLLYKCKWCYTIFRTINTLNLHKCEYYADAGEETMECDTEETKIITIDNIHPVYENLISEADIHVEPPEDTENKARNTWHNDED